MLWAWWYSDERLDFEMGLVCQHCWNSLSRLHTDFVFGAHAVSIPELGSREHERNCSPSMSWIVRSPSLPAWRGALSREFRLASLNHFRLRELPTKKSAISGCACEWVCWCAKLQSNFSVNEKGNLKLLRYSSQFATFLSFHCQWNWEAASQRRG